ncbi:MAG: GtrA family protein [Planctomycetes bacterium]|nr:GtrA family protein [Planctomycetota bacterium]
MPACADDHPHALSRQAARFALVGCVSIAADAAVMALLLHHGMSANWAKGCSFVAGMCCGFAGNKLWTFGSRERSWSEPARFLLLYSATLMVNVGLNAAVLTWLSREGLLHPRQVAATSFLCATGASTILNFLGTRYLVFSRARIPRNQPSG